MRIRCKFDATPEQLEEAKRFLKKGWKPEAVAAKFGCSVVTLQMRLRDYARRTIDQPAVG
jgi:hypothetical protein